MLLHGRSSSKLSEAKKQLSEIAKPEQLFTYQADLSSMSETMGLTLKIKEEHKKLDTLINNAGVFIVPDKLTSEGLDVRFMVNTIAPFILTQELLPLLDNTGRVINLSSAAQSSLSSDELLKPSSLSDNAVYAKSKLALTMWSRQLGLSLAENGPVIVSVNPKSFLGSKMVEEAYGVAGGNLQQGADILVRATLSDEFSNASGLYFDNDIGQFTDPHPDALDVNKAAEITKVIETIVQKVS